MPASGNQAPRVPCAPSAGDRGDAEMLELSRSQCLRLLATEHFGRLAVRLGDGPPLVRPVNYRFDVSLQSVVFRSAAGSKLHALLNSAMATFEIDGIDRASRTGWSVIIQGITEEVTAPSVVARLDRLGPSSWAPGPKPTWMHIRARTVTGRQILLPSATPGLYLG